MCGKVTHYFTNNKDYYLLFNKKNEELSHDNSPFDQLG